MTFEEWLGEIENFSSRSERLYEDFLEVKDLAKLRMWLEAAYEVGRKELEAENEKLRLGLEVYSRERNRYRHAKPEITGAYFLSGGHGEKDDDMIPRFVEICPAYGCAWVKIYEDTGRIISYEGS